MRVTTLRYPDPPLQDGVVRLRPWAAHDIAPATAATRDPSIPRYTRVPEHQTEEGLREFIALRAVAREAGEALTFVVADAGSDAFLGTVALLRFDWEQRRGEIGYWLASWARGRGVMTRAVALLSRWALADLGLARLALHTYVENAVSQAVAVRCGFRREGVLRSYEERKGRRYDVVVFSLVPGDLQPEAEHDARPEPRGDP